MAQTSALSRLPTAPSGRLRAVPGQWTNDPDVFPSTNTLKTLGKSSKVSRSADMLASQLRNAGKDPEQEPEYQLLDDIRKRKELLEGEQSRLRTLFRRFDNLYYPDTIQEQGGADHWAPEAKQGRVHISLNNPPVYVDIPASLQSTVPVENYVSKSSKQEDIEAASRAEQLYFQWKDDAEFELEIHRACIIKGLYGFTFAKVYWDPIEKMPRVRVIDTPENLYVGWGDSDFRRIDWTVYCYGLSPQAVEEDYGLTVAMLPGKQDGEYYPWVYSATHDDPIGSIYKHDRIRRNRYEDSQVEVYDYWYRKPAGKGKRPEVWNAIFVGNALVSNARHTEFDDIPYVPLTNTFIPGSPYGRSELYDLEQLFREKDERLSNAAQMIQSIVGGQMWQVVGSEAPDSVSDNLVPRPGKVATPGPNAELKAIQPFMPQFAIEDYLKRLDHELEGLSGLNDLLLGHAPATILGSSKAITALVANYEARIRIKRDLLYSSRRRIWTIAAKLWERKDSDVKRIIDGQYRLSVTAPELTPRDQLETANKVISLVQNRLMSMARGMDQIGIEDPEEEMDLIRREQTDPALNPVAVQTQVSLAAAMQQFGVQPGQAPGQQTQAQTENAYRQATPAQAGTQSMNAPEEQGQRPPEALPANARGKAQVQTMVQGGEASSRILTATPLEG